MYIRNVITKEKLKNYIDNFPDEISIDDLIDRLVFVEKLETRLKESAKGGSFSEEELNIEIEKWLK